MKHYYTSTDDTRLYRVAVALHPLCRFTWFKNNWSQVPDSEVEIANAHHTVYKCWHYYLTSREALVLSSTSDNLTSTPSPASQTSHTTIASSKTSATPANQCTARFYELMGIRTQELGESELLAAKERERLRTKGELERFIQAELDLKGFESEPLRWWQELGKKEYPTLAGLAFTVFSMPAMSSECDRAVSRAGKMITDDRYQLKADIIEANQLLKSWLARQPH